MANRDVKRILLLLFTVFLLLSFCGFVSSITALASSGMWELHTGYNVVFVMDTSGSLGLGTNPTDPNRLREQGLGMILSWLPGTNSRVGLVTFSTTAEVFENNLRLVNSQSDVEDFYYAVQKPLGQYTNITQALDLATGFFSTDRGMDPELPNLIVLFTDGILDLPVVRTQADPSPMLKIADDAKANNILIATIALNNNNTVDEDKLQILSQIASDGLYWKITSSSELTDAFNEMHDSLFYSEKHPLEAGEDWFSVPKYGANSLTFTFFSDTPNDTFTLTSPDGTVYSEADTYKLSGLSIITIEKPPYGQWFSDISSGNAISTVAKQDNLSSWQKGLNTWLSMPLGLIVSGVVSLIPSIITGVVGSAISNKITNKRPGGLIVFIFVAIFVFAFYIFCIAVLRINIVKTLQISS